MHLSSNEHHVRLHEEQTPLRVATKGQTTVETRESLNSLTEDRNKPTPRATLGLKSKHLDPSATPRSHGYITNLSYRTE